MADDKLSGISVGGDRSDDRDKDEKVNLLTDELQVSDLSELDEEQLDIIRATLDDEEDLKGITAGTEASGRGQQAAKERARQVKEVEREQVFEAQLTQLEGIDDNTTLLRDIAAGIKTTNNLLQTTNDLLSDIFETGGGQTGFTVKDSNRIEFADANSSRDVVDKVDDNTTLILIKANVQNEGNLYLGEEGLGVGQGYTMEPGEKEQFRVDILISPFHIVAENGGDKYTYIALGSE